VCFVLFLDDHSLAAIKNDKKPGIGKDGRIGIWRPVVVRPPMPYDDPRRIGKVGGRFCPFVAFWFLSAFSWCLCAFVSYWSKNGFCMGRTVVQSLVLYDDPTLVNG
jgi:hypothetical protein